VTEAETPDVAAAAKTHKLAFTNNVKVDLNKTEATPQIGRAAGFHEAVTRLESGKVSAILASAEGRFFFRLKSRDKKQATIDVVAALYDRLRSEVKIDDEAVRAYYDEHRDTAYVTGDEIREAPEWESLSESVRKRVAEDLRKTWRKRPLLVRLNALRDSALFEAFRAYPSDHPLQTRRPIRLTVRATGPFKPDSPPALFSKQPGLLKAVQKLKPGQLSQPLEARTGAILALLTSRQDDGTLDAAYVRIQSWDVDQAAPADPAEETLRAYYQEHKEQLRVPDQLQIQYLAASYDDLAKTIEITEQEAKEEYDQGVAKQDTAYRDHTKLPDYVPLPFEKVRETAERQVALRKAQEKAKSLLAEAQAVIQKQEGAPDFEAAAAKSPMLEAGLSSFFKRDQRTLEPVGLAPELVEKAFAAKEDELIGPVSGLDGACLARRNEFRPTHVPPFEDVRAAVLADYRRREANRKALDAAQRLRERVAPALEQAENAAEAFRAAVEAKPLEVSVPKTVAASLTPPFYPEGAPMARRNTGPAQHAEFIRAAFSLRPAQLSEVVFNDDRTTCYVLTPTHFLPPDEPAPFQLSRTRMALARRTSGILRAAWQAHLEEQIATEP
jgi:parvulin-like peptidyl-prolyl isomerase